MGPRPRPQPKKPRQGFSGLRDRDGEEEGDEEEEEGGQIAAEQFDDNWASVVDDEAGERLLGRNRNDDEGLDNNKTKKKGRKLGISVMRVIMMMMIDRDYVALTHQIEDIAGFDVVVEILKSIGCRLVVTIIVAVLVEKQFKTMGNSSSDYLYSLMSTEHFYAD
ncbi:hypothetical protein KIW84_044466 [Lathyrus oleraceus]|uniref:Uncharacterized protein n=1 Tax=Pisum sativum TaxID=3888 RepID=A0A9D4XGL1_PEA|nr:hypothetical protein KIW84_044466 [Pisum sativum]